MAARSGHPGEQLLLSLDRAAIDPMAWPEVCDDLAALVDARGAVFIPRDAAQRDASMPHSASLAGVMQSFVETGWHRCDLRAEKGFPRALAFGHVTDQDFITPEEMRSHPYYCELLEPHGLKWFAGIALDVNGKTWGVAVHGSAERGPFLSGDVEALAGVRGQLELAARRAAALGNQRVTSLDATFAFAARGLAALDASGRIAWLNERAETLLRDPGLLRNGQVRARDPALDRKLCDLVDAALAFRPDGGAVLPGPVAVPVDAGRMLAIDVIPMPRDFQTLLSGACALATIHEVAPPAASPEGRWQRYRLTARELELAAHLVEGRGLADAAAAMGISVLTARQHLRSVFAKTGTGRQAELVATLARDTG